MSCGAASTRNLYVLPAVLLTGTLASQILFAVMIHVSNLRLDQTVSMLSAAGYLTVPNHLVAAGLQDWKPALAGALFFSLTVGAGLSLAGFIATLAWRALPGSRRIGLIVAGALWGLLLYRINGDGINGWATAACVIIPLTASAATLAIVSPKAEPSPWRALAFPLAAVLIILAFWIPRADGDTFIRIRDHLLLSNSPGKKITGFYYQYTLYPAEVFKSLDQKLLKTSLIRTTTPELRSRLEDLLRAHDYLTIEEKKPVDLEITEENGRLVLRQNSREVLAVPATDFTDDPEAILTEFSEKTDNWRFFRRLTFLSLVSASPFLLVLLVQTVIFALLFFLRPIGVRLLLSSLICAGLGVALSFSAGAASDQVMTRAEIERNLFSSRRSARIEALRTLSEKNSDIDAYPEMAASAHERTVPERYWLAKALAGGRSAWTDNLLRDFLKDPHPNVVCMALFSLGNRPQNRAAAIEEMIHLIKTSDHWYIQWYAYRSLRSLGWIQPASPRRN
jgi:hypothetical protein